MKASAADINGQPDRPTSSLYADCEDVFTSRHDRLPGAPVRTFGELEWDANTVVPRRANVRSAKLVIGFPKDPSWSLRSREIAMTLLNTQDPRLIERSISFGSVKFSIGHVHSRSSSYKIAAAWQADKGLPDNISLWDRQEWIAMVNSVIAGNRAKGTVCNLINAIRDLVRLSAVLTGGGIEEDPWNGAPATAIAAKAKKGTTHVISPKQWVPLMGACWTYIGTFADDILSLRQSHQCQIRIPKGEKKSRQYLDYTELLKDFLSSSYAVVPMRKGRAGNLQPCWSWMSRLVTANRSEVLFRDVHGRRRIVEEAISFGGVPCRMLSPSEFGQLMKLRIAHWQFPEGARAAQLSSHYDALLEAWIADHENKVAVYDPTANGFVEGDINWTMMAWMVFKTAGRNPLFEGRHSAPVRRRIAILHVARSGRVFKARSGLLGTPRKCIGFASIHSPGGQLVPWRDVMTDFEARSELRALRAACYLFIAAMTMMRDSEIQDLQRGCVRDFYGVPAVKSNVYKGRPTAQPAHWWIVDEVATAVRVLEKLSVHPQYLFASYVEGDYEDTEPGIYAGREIEWFLRHLAETGARSGLAPVPSGPSIHPRALRRTTACISRELGGNELAVSHQLKHVIDYGWANATAGYMARDRGWANFLGTNRSEQNLDHMVTMMRESAKRGQQLAGKGAQRLTQALTNSSAIDENTAYRATLLSDSELRSLLKKIAPEIHFGPANACLYDAQTALCQRHANTGVEGPVLGLCQPARCHNAVIGAEHLPVWITELSMLTKTLSDQRLSPPRRQMLTDRLTDIEHVLAQAIPPDQGPQ